MIRSKRPLTKGKIFPQKIFVVLKLRHLQPSPNNEVLALVYICVCVLQPATILIALMGRVLEFQVQVHFLKLDVIAPVDLVRGER